jgi:hypothetical protein
LPFVTSHESPFEQPRQLAALCDDIRSIEAALTGSAQFRRIQFVPAVEQPEQEIERLVREIGIVVRSNDPERQDQLKEFASTLVNQELSPIGASEQRMQQAAGRSMNPLAAGLGLLIIGAGLSFLIPLVGIMLGAVGLIGIAWGAVMSWTKK